MLISVALTDVSYFIAIVRQCMEYILDLSRNLNQECRVSSYPPLLKTLVLTLRILVSFYTFRLSNPVDVSKLMSEILFNNKLKLFVSGAQSDYVVFFRPFF